MPGPTDVLAAAGGTAAETAQHAERQPARRGGPLARRGGPLARRVSFAALLVVVSAALLVGSGAFDGSPATPAQRAAAIESRIRCPSCEDLSVAQSSAPTAIAVRHRIAAMVRQGASDARIEASLVSRYGASILLLPAASGVGVIVYVLPAVGAAASLAIVAVVFWRRSRAFRQLRSDAP